MFLSKLFTNAKSKNDASIQKETAIHRNLLRREAQIGGTLFGPVPKGGKREFFCLDESTWVWHEEWIDMNGQRHTKNTRFDVRPTGILKAQNGHGYHMVGAEEATNLVQAIELYVTRVREEVYAAF